MMTTALLLTRDEEDKEGIPLFAPHEKVYPRAVRERQQLQPP